jgi:ABC-type uncharacterized transport system involved in gliding motility auxiliary subunit
MNKNQARVISLLSAAIFLLAFLISGRLFFRLDLTKNKAYTISEVSKNLYKEISDQVRITYFVSEKLRQVHPMPGEIADLLREYAANSRGKIRFFQKDPAKAGLLQAVEDLGIEPQQIQLAEQNEITVATVYSGILIEYLDRESVIPVVFSLDTLEYDLSSRIRSLVHNIEREIGVIVGDSYSQWESEYGILNEELVFAGFRVRLIKAGDYIPSSLPALFVFGGVEDLDEEQLLPIDNYILGGGNVLFALDGVFVDTRRGFEARKMQDRGLLTMLANYGVVVPGALVNDVLALNLTFQTQSRNGTVIQTMRYPQWLGIPEQMGNPDHPLTARFLGLDLYWASPLELNPPQGVSADVLFASSPQAWLQTERFVTNPNYYSQFQDEADYTRGTKILGASLSGIFPSAFQWRSEPVIRKPSRLIVVGNSHFAGSIMQANRGEGRNLDFLIKAADWLSNDEDIVAIRGRQAQAGRLDRIADRDKRNRAMAFSRTINTIVIPLGVVLAGLFLNWKRRAKTSKDKGHSIDV